MTQSNPNEILIPVDIALHVLGQIAEAFGLVEGEEYQAWAGEVNIIEEQLQHLKTLQENYLFIPKADVPELLKPLRNEAKICGAVSQLIKSRGYSMIYAQDQIEAWGKKKIILNKRLDELEAKLVADAMEGE